MLIVKKVPKLGLLIQADFLLVHNSLMEATFSLDNFL
jgi:hypothetical protein